ncbi:MAG: hypothetical protein AAGD07_18185, partial [Planctomycetota bacterium]
IQEGYLKKLISPERKRSASVSARVIRDRYPEIHLLQRDWLESILRCQENKRPRDINLGYAILLAFVIAKLFFVFYLVS